MLVHHTGKDASKGLRGHSSLFAAMDGVIEVTREGERRQWKVAKSKDGSDGGQHSFRLRVVGLGEDDGEPVSSCVIDHVHTETPSPATRPNVGKNQRPAVRALTAMFDAKAPASGEPGAVDLEEAVSCVAAVLDCLPARRNERARVAINGLVESGMYCQQGGRLWRP